jgi:transforming growth factor-beta-induced protein
MQMSSRALRAAAATCATLFTAACGDATSYGDSPEALANRAPQAGAALAAKPGNSTIVELAQQTDALNTLVALILSSDARCETNFAELLSGAQGQYTVFAPTNDAFVDLLREVPAEVATSCEVLPSVLAYHVTRGRHTSNSVLAQRSLRMLNDERAVVSGATVAGARLNLELVNISASNGVVHVVDDVLLPPSILAALAGN